VETELDLTGVSGKALGAPADDGAEPKVRRDVDVEVNGKRFSVAMWVPESAAAPVAAAGGGGARKAKPRRSGGGAAAAAGSGHISIPMQGTIVKVLVAEGDEVTAGQTLCVLEAMKMENNILADKDGTVSQLKVEAGQSVSAGDLAAVIE
jgi:acetyl-CoA/propionyl-CoA carboxylase biotin carboxyl carrier protein